MAQPSPACWIVSRRAVGGTDLALEFGQVGQTTLTAEVVGRVANQLDAQGPTFLQILLDPGVAVEDVDADLGADLAGQDELGLVGMARSRLSMIRLSKKARGMTRSAEDQGWRDLESDAMESSHQ